MRFRYVGKGEWLPGYPARDIDENEVNAYTDDDIAYLLASGLYEVEEDYDELDDLCEDCYNSEYEDEEE